MRGGSGGILTRGQEANGQSGRYRGLRNKASFLTTILSAAVQFSLARYSEYEFRIVILQQAGQGERHEPQ